MVVEGRGAKAGEEGRGRENVVDLGAAAMVPDAESFLQPNPIGAARKRARTAPVAANELDGRRAGDIVQVSDHRETRARLAGEDFVNEAANVKRLARAPHHAPQFSFG